MTRSMRNAGRLLAWVLCVTGTCAAVALDTENHDFRILPAPGPVAVDGDTADWDLSGGLFACGEVEHLRDQFSVWLHAMHDAEYLYVLARWKDPTPLNNNATFGGHGFNGDSLQVRFVLFPDTPDACATWWDGWRDRHGVSIVGRGSPGKRNGFPLNPLPDLPNATHDGVLQAFRVDPDGQGYTQEIAIPWAMLSAKGTRPDTGAPFRMTFEPNFTAGQYGRITIKDLFDARVAKPDRVFTFRAFKHWGWATLSEQGGVEPRPVRTADGRTFAVHLEDGRPAVDWNGLATRFAWPGFLPVTFDMPYDGTASVNILDADGRPVRHLVNGEPFTKGRHTVQWDGLGDAVYRTPGQPVGAGTYTWKAVVHPDVKLTFRGFAHYGGRAPWSRTAEDEWLGDHGVPSAARFDGQRMILASNGAEGGRHLIALDADGRLRWGLQNTVGGGDPDSIAVDGTAVYVLHRKGWKGTGVIARVNADTGAYIPWEGRDSHILSEKDLWPDVENPARPLRIAAGFGRLFLSDPESGLTVLDAATGNVQTRYPLPGLVDVDPLAADRLLAIVGNDLVTLRLADGPIESTPFAAGLDEPAYLTRDADGRVYVSLRGASMRVAVYDAEGRAVGAVGRAGGRAPIGPWQADGLLQPGGLAVDAQGQLWVMEMDRYPKRVSVWSLADGTLRREFFGPAHYGASGGAISMRDPNVMVGSGCEWKLDPETGRAACVGVFDRRTHGYATFREAEGREFLYTFTGRYGTGETHVWERRGPADYALRAHFDVLYDKEDTHYSKNGRARGIQLWTDANGDGERQPDEIVRREEGYLGFSGSNSWSLNLGYDLALYGFDTKAKRMFRLKPTLAAMGDGGKGPVYDLARPEILPAHLTEQYRFNYSCFQPDRDNTTVLACLDAPGDRTMQYWVGFDMETWLEQWRYPNPYFQVHGSHKAPAPDWGLFRGAYGPVGTGSFPGVGSFWLINGNLGEWNALSSEGFFLSRVFSGNVFEWRWPEAATPGVDMTNLPPGSGGEDFGGSAVQADDGRMYIQAGKNSYWNIGMTGFENAVVQSGGPIVLTDEGVRQSIALRENALQAGRAAARYTIKRGAPVADAKSLKAALPGAEILEFQKSPDAKVQAAMLYDDAGLHVGWQVADTTPWVNGATDISQVYAQGDTVDLQLQTVPDARRDKAAPGDLRLAVGPVGGVPTAVLYRFVAGAGQVKKPREFSSGVVQNWQVDVVESVALPLLSVTAEADKKTYRVLATIPWTTLDVPPPEGGTEWRGDVGATHGDPAGRRTRLRTYWANQQTGLVDDVVFELQPAPRNWGDWVFGQ